MYHEIHKETHILLSHAAERADIIFCSTLSLNLSDTTWEWTHMNGRYYACIRGLWLLISSLRLNSVSTVRGVELSVSPQLLYGSTLASYSDIHARSVWSTGKRI